ncbi:hypothetical protein L3Q82_000303 [Scortum barcoo]|uniref:Uncharacterized protein n=1 Tax=Scortum barcoo TaxID=214431 RepID=A0ACB8XB08_9TELE|nr:hypothetical protein L3Q82_000303 [Scortum barcoo]
MPQYQDPQHGDRSPDSEAQARNIQIQQHNNSKYRNMTRQMGKRKEDILKLSMGPKAQTKVTRTEVVEDSPEEGAVGGVPVSIHHGEDPLGPAERDSITGMLQQCLHFQRDLSERWERETVKQDKRWRLVQIQVNNLRDELEEQQRAENQTPGGTPPPPPPQQEGEQVSQSRGHRELTGRGWGQAAVPRLDEGDDIEQYLTTFERLAVAYQWPEVDWAVRLIPHLTGKARAAYVAMAADETSDYKKVKEAILLKYEINEEVYRQRFREPDVRPYESPREFYNRLKDLYNKWLQPEKRTKDQIGEILVLEQFYRSLSPELRVWVKERDPESAREAAQLVETFLAARRGSKNYRFEVSNKSSAARAVYLEVAGQTYLVPVGVIDGLAHQVILGQDIPILQELVQSCRPVNIVTRSQMRTQRREAGELSRSQTGPDENLQGPEIQGSTEQDPNVLSELPVFDEDLLDRAVKTRKSRRQKRQEKMAGTVRIGSGLEELEDGEAGKSCDFVQLQRQDESLQDFFKQAKAVQQGQVAGEGYFLRDQVLYYKADRDDGERLVVPQGLREQVLQLGHSIPWAGHLGTKKTLDRIASRFYWPGLSTQVQEYCQSCSVCQLTGDKRVPKFPLQPLPVIDVPFSRIAMDIVGPLERTQSGHRYILVICDYSTRYPEAFPLRDITAKQIAYALLQLFSRVGIPSEILTDQGTNFLSDILRQVYRLLGIKSIRTTPYHPQTDGLVERYNRTLKSMLKKFISTNAKDWDKWLPYLLFAYREVPQASTGFSPFELLYGRQVRGPLDVLQESWVGSQEKRTSVLAFVLQMRERMEQTTKLVRRNMEKAQSGQQTWYDKAARERSFSPGQQVLLLLPKAENKLLAKWQGPYTVLKKLSPTTYEIEMLERRNPKQTFHINLLKEWKTREIPPQQQMFVRRMEEEEDDIVGELALASSNSKSLDLSHLSLTQQKDLQAIVPPDLFQERPGATNLVEHDIRLKDCTPIRQRMYRIPQKLVPVLEEEVTVMLELGVIEPSTSEWSNPIVLVIKKDGSIRFCIDFRKVNAQSEFDAYPLPRLDDLIERVGQARFITTLDLCKGYWQVPLSDAARPLTAFRTPQGLWQFTKMPFGLHGAPATFQRLMNKVLAGMHTFAAAYLDDIVIYSNSWQEHLSHVAKVLREIKKAGLTINPRKCAVAKQETQYLGYVLGGGVIKPVQDKVEAIRARERPTTRKQVKSFLGLVGWYRRFIPGFSARAAPLTDLTSTTKTKVMWGEEQEKAFQDLKQALCQEPVLQSPNFDLPFTVQTDASNRGIGGVLLQGEGEEKKPVAYISRKLFSRETRYSAVELECLAIKWAIDTFKYYLLGREFNLETDHKALQWLERMKDTNSRITRWFLSLQPYRFSIHYRPGKQNTVADFLSRNVVGEPAGGEEK